MPEASVELPRTVWRDGTYAEDSDAVVQEAPVALVYNGVSHAVMMATPTDLQDLALGFSLSERIISGPNQLLGMDLQGHASGTEVAIITAWETPL